MSLHSRSLERKSLTRRALFLGSAGLVALGVLSSRLYYLQVQQSSRYKLNAEQNRIRDSLILPRRGLILDRFGHRLADNRTVFKLKVSTALPSEDITTLLTELSQVVALTPAELRALRTLLENAPRHLEGVVFHRSLNREEMSQIVVRRPWLNHTELLETYQRYYPRGAAFSHVVGYIGQATPERIRQESLTPLTIHPDMLFGHAGMERLLDRRLRGEAGVKHYEITAQGRKVRELDTRKSSVAGQNITLTLDGDLQAHIYEILKERAGAVVVLDLPFGEVRAMVSSPGFDPQGFVDGINPEHWRTLKADPLKPFLNKAIAGTYAPGSTIKPVLALAALQAGIAPEYTTYCSGKWHSFHCWREEGHGRVDVVKSLRESCDIWFYHVGQKLGMHAMAQALRSFGLGETFGILEDAEKAGLVPTPAWKKRALGEPWYRGETVITSIGQGFMLATPLQLAVMMGRLASGLKVRPYMLADLPRQRPPSMNLNPNHRAVVKEAMFQVVRHARGTARHLRSIPDFAFAGKTGTSQVRHISTEERNTGIIDNQDLPYHLRDHALFVGYGPHPYPRYALSVLVAHSGSGSTYAAPIAREIFHYLQTRKTPESETPEAQV